MKTRTWLSRIATGALLAIGFLASAAMLPDLPATVATHWNAAGQADGGMSRLMGAFFVPALTALLVPVLYLAPRIDPEWTGMESFRGVYEWFVTGFVGFMLSIHGIVLAWNLGYQFSFNGVLAVALAGFSLGCGEFEARIDGNRLGAWGFRVTGVVTLVVGVVVPSLVVPVVLVGVVVTGVGVAVVEDREQEAGVRSR